MLFRSSFAEIEQPLDRREAELIARVDQVFIHSPALLAKKGHLNPRTAFVPNGVDYVAYSSPAAEPADLAAIPRPRVGYVGMIKEMLDLRLLASLAARHPDWSFVLVGPARGSAENMAALAAPPNVHLLGARPVEVLPGYIQHMDVCLLPYRETGYTKFIYPLKLHEYLATGRPVVGAPIPTLRELEGPVTLAHTVEEWSEAITRALGPEGTSPVAVEARRRVAREHDWDRLVGRIARSMLEQLGMSP